MGAFDDPQPASVFQLPDFPTYSIQDRGGFFTSPNCPAIPSFPDPTDIGNSSPSELRSRRWSVNEYPYLAFLPVYPFIGSIMSVFATPVEHLHLERSLSSKWRLPYSTAKQWKETEHTIRKVADNLLQYLVRKNPELTDLWVSPTKPSAYGYFDQHSSEINARTAIRTSVDAFVISATYLSFVIALCQVYPGDLVGTMLSRIFEEAGVTVHAEWLSTLQFTWIADFSCNTSRLGSVVDVHSCKWLNLVPYMLRFNIPIWFYWGHPPSSPKWINHSWIAEFAYRHPKHLLAPQNAEAGSFPPVEALSGQRPGETMRAFFSRRKVQYQQDKKKESYQLKQARWAREKAQAEKNCPGRKGPTVFFWEKVGQAGVRIRTLLTRKLVEHQWDFWGRNQKFYDSFANEWDCCSEWSFEPWQKGDSQPPAQTYRSNASDGGDDDGDDYFGSIYGSGSSALRKPDIPHAPASIAPASMLSVSPKILPSASLHADMPGSSVQLDSGHTCPMVEIGKFASSELAAQPADLLIQTSPMIDTNILAPSSLSLDSDHLASLDDVNMDAAYMPSLDWQPLQDAVNIDPANILQHKMKEDINMGDQTAVGNEAGKDSARDEFSNYVFSGYVDSLSDEDMNRINLLDLSTKQVLTMNPVVPTVQAPPKDENLDELIYFRYGYSLLESPYQSLPSMYDKMLSEHPFNTWSTVWRTLGAQQVSTSGSIINPICEFLAILLGSKRPFHDVPGKFWDLSPVNHRPLKMFLPLHIYIETREFQNSSVPALCLIHPRGDSSMMDSSWTVGVQPFIALECVRRSIGPCRIGILQYLIENGIPCHTLHRQVAHMTPLNMASACSQRLQILGPRPLAYKFSIADYAAYETLRDSFLLAQPCGRRALCFGGIIARLARECLPTSAVSSGPSTSALQGDAEIFEVKDTQEIYFDDLLSEEAKDLICGTYSIDTGRKGSTAYVSWYPRWNVWEGSGLNVCHWGQECEDFYLRRRAEILGGRAVPLSGAQWRQRLRLTRHAPKLIHKMNAAAISFLQSSQGNSLSGLS